MCGHTAEHSIQVGMRGSVYSRDALVEVLPDKDAAEITALLAANIMYEFLSLIALNKKNVNGHPVNPVHS